ncbi:STAS domain-containing protein [Paenibacillus alkaliterrae]|uniref:STAS domain-containing protein n=1 Tax=Paenibacillus alkaliterrae TaxID=320909 RepID=UPI001F2B88AE|nr:STAS domain-containing protein [Paenibacillus alkaliterrae]MCF2939402.1 STAS domain-containing protein [Paenibacillus alkaliterrae]
MNSEFQADKRVSAGAVIYDLKGYLSNSAEDSLLGIWDWEQGLDQGSRFLIFNFTQVTYINSIGIAVLIRIVRALLKQGCRTFAYGITPHYQKLFRMVGLTEHMMIYPNELSILQRIEYLREE